MSINPEGREGAAKRQFPESILVVDVAHPSCGEVELEIVSGEFEWGDLPTATYVRGDVAAE